MNELLLIGGMAFVTFGIRYPVLALLGRIDIPAPVLRALRFVPVAVLSALSAPLIFTSEGQWFISLANPALLASFGAVLVAWKTGNLLYTITAGMMLFALVKLLTGWV